MNKSDRLAIAISEFKKIAEQYIKERESPKFNFLKLFKRRKPQIIPFDTYGQSEPKYQSQTPGNKCKILSFKYHNGYLTDPRLAAGNQASPEKPTGRPCKLDFIWDHLP